MASADYSKTKNYSNLLKTIEYFKDSSPNLIYEQIIKTLAEPIVSDAIRECNEKLKTYHNPLQPKPQQHTPQKWFLFNRGGDSLNYYYPINRYVPTNDWDLGIMNITDTEIDLIDFDGITYWLTHEFLQPLANKLSTFFGGSRKNQIDEIPQRVKQEHMDRLVPSAFGGYFIHQASSFKRLHQIYFTYDDGTTTNANGIIIRNGVRTKNEMIDVMIYGNGLSEQYIPDILGWEKKFEYKDLEIFLKDRGEKLENYTQIFVDKIQSEDKRYYGNAYKLLVQDKSSGIYYMAPGDLLSDTLLMIWQTIKNRKIRINKLSKYLSKCAILIDAINQMIDICPDDTCEMVNQTILSRNTDGFVSDDFFNIPGPQAVLDLFYNNVTTEYVDYVLDKTSMSKLVQMVVYFKIYKMMKELMFPGKVLHAFKEKITTQQMYRLTQLYMLLNSKMIQMESLQRKQIEALMVCDDTDPVIRKIIQTDYGPD
jgi:hypothetical protein